MAEISVKVTMLEWAKIKDPIGSPELHGQQAFDETYLGKAGQSWLAADHPVVIGSGLVGQARKERQLRKVADSPIIYEWLFIYTGTGGG